MTRVLALAIGFVLDLVLGDPRGFPHPVRAIGGLISFLDGRLRAVAGGSAHAQRVAGCALVVLVVGASCAAVSLTLWLCALISPVLALVMESVMCYQMLAAKSLRVESTRVERALEEGTLDDARRAVSMIVGRDTGGLTEEGVAKAAVETVAENTSDGVVAPLLFMALFGAVGGVFYKAVNTMDSMVGYKNDVYRDFGWAAARLDDVLNFIPARVAGVLMCAAAWVVRFDGHRAWRVFLRDRHKHTSPNAAHTEAACAGALGVQLAGSNYYFGKLVEKPTLGDATRAVEPADIARANRLMYATSVLALMLSLCVAAALGLVASSVSGMLLNSGWEAMA